MSNYNSHNNMATMPEIQCLVSPRAKLPVRAHPSDAGADMHCWLTEWAHKSPFFMRGLSHVVEVDKLVIPPGEQMLIDTGIGMKIPTGFAGFVGPRSSQRVKGITCWGDGIIDSTYRGNIKVVLANNGKSDYVIENGDRIAQIVIKRVELVGFVDTWNDTERGTGGFGSTGK